MHVWQADSPHGSIRGSLSGNMSEQIEHRSAESTSSFL
jgi:hypothetical protein